MINIPLRPISLERTSETDNGNWADVTVIDRFDYDGNYLDCYVIPTICDQMIYYDGELFVSNWIECSIYRYIVRFSDVVIRENKTHSIQNLLNPGVLQ